MASLAGRIGRELKAVGTPKRAAGEKRYLKSDLTFWGATLGDIRRVAKDVWKSEELHHDELIVLVEELWARRVFDLRMTASLLLEFGAADLDGHDLDLTEWLIRDSKTWALVDVLAGDVVGSINLNHRIKQRLDRWAKDYDFWVRRASLLAELLPLKSGRPFAPFAARADAMLEDKEFFIRKAIGWVLREMSKTRADEVYAWIAPRTQRASGVTMREVVRRLPERRAVRLMDAYRQRVPAR